MNGALYLNSASLIVRLITFWGLSSKDSLHDKFANIILYSEDFLLHK